MTGVEGHVEIDLSNTDFSIFERISEDTGYLKYLKVIADNLDKIKKLKAMDLLRKIDSKYPADECDKDWIFQVAMGREDVEENQ